jgi:hypothetical protein
VRSGGLRSVRSGSVRCSGSVRSGLRAGHVLPEEVQEALPQGVRSGVLRSGRLRSVRPGRLRSGPVRSGLRAGHVLPEEVQEASPQALLRSGGLLRSGLRRLRRCSGGRPRGSGPGPEGCPPGSAGSGCPQGQGCLR